MKPSLKTEWFSVVTILAALIIGWWAYPNLPDMVPSHWNIAGEVDGWSTRLGHTLGIPATMLGVYLLFPLIRKIEPRKLHFEKSIGFYNLIRNFLMGFFLYIFVIATWAGLSNEPVPMNTFIPFAIGILFILLGNYMSQIKSNFFMGIRTPWTLSSDTVWQKTHLLGGYTFVIGGILFVFTPFFPEPFNFYIPITGILIAALVPIVYSYILYEQGKK